MTNNIRYKYIPIKQGSIPTLLAQWKDNDLSIDWFRDQTKHLRDLADQRFKEKTQLKTFTPLPRFIINYSDTHQSKSEISFLYYLAHRYIHKLNYARFKLDDITALTGISRQKLSRAINSLTLQNIITKTPLHPNFIIANGSQYSLILTEKKGYIDTPKKVTSEGVKRLHLLH